MIVDFIRRELDARGMLQVDLAKSLGWTEVKLSQILNRHRGITAEEFLAVLHRFGYTVPGLSANTEPRQRLAQAASRIDDAAVEHLTSLALMLERDRGRARR